jgi:hypothetical protein
VRRHDRRTEACGGEQGCRSNLARADRCARGEAGGSAAHVGDRRETVPFGEVHPAALAERLERYLGPIEQPVARRKDDDELLVPQMLDRALPVGRHRADRDVARC